MPSRPLDAKSLKRWLREQRRTSKARPERTEPLDVRDFTTKDAVDLSVIPTDRLLAEVCARLMTTETLLLEYGAREAAAQFRRRRR